MTVEFVKQQIIEDKSFWKYTDGELYLSAKIEHKHVIVGGINPAGTIRIFIPELKAITELLEAVRDHLSD